MTLPVSSYEELLARVRSLTSETIQLRREITSSLCDPPLLGSASLPSNINYDHHMKAHSTLMQERTSVDEDLNTVLASNLRGTGVKPFRTSLLVDKKEDEVDNEFKEIDEKLTSPDTPVEKNTFHRNVWAPDNLGLWHSGPSSLNLGQASNNYAPQQDLTASCNSYEPQYHSLSSSSSKRTYSHQQLGAKVEMVYSLLSMLDMDNREDMSKTFLAMSSSPESCHAMRQSGCLPLLIQLIHSSELNKEVRKRAAEALSNIVHAQADEKRRRREVRVLKLLQQVREYCEELKSADDHGISQLQEESEKHLINATGTLMKFSFDAEHRQAICTLGGLHAITELIQVDHEVHGCTNDDTHCITLRRYANMSLTNLTFADGKNKSLLCSFNKFMHALVDQLKSPSEDLRQVTASVLRNLSWRADSESKQALRNVGAVTALTVAAMEAKKESTLKSILSALWNLSGLCSLNKIDICSVPGALAFLVKMLRYKSTSSTLAIVENAGGILRNISSHVAVREDYRQILRDNNCFEVLLEQLKSPSLTIVSNACGTLWNLSARCQEDQRRLWEMGATSMLRSLVQSKHKMISMGSSAALKNLLAANPNENLFTHLDSTAKSLGLQNLPTLFVRKKRALEQELNITLAETCENIEPIGSPNHFNPLQDKIEEKKTNGPRRSDSHDSVQSTQSDSTYERLNQITQKNDEKLLENKSITLHDSLDEKSISRKVEDQKLMKRYKISMIPMPTLKKMNQDRINEKTREETAVEDSMTESILVTDLKPKGSSDSKEKTKKGIPVLSTRLKNNFIHGHEPSVENCSSLNNLPQTGDQSFIKNEENKAFEKIIVENYPQDLNSGMNSQVVKKFLSSDVNLDVNRTKKPHFHLQVNEVGEKEEECYYSDRNKNEQESLRNAGGCISNIHCSAGLDDENKIPVNNNLNHFNKSTRGVVQKTVSEHDMFENEILNNCSLNSSECQDEVLQSVASDERLHINSDIVRTFDVEFTELNLQTEQEMVNFLPKNSVSKDCERNTAYGLVAAENSRLSDSRKNSQEKLEVDQSDQIRVIKGIKYDSLCQKTDSKEETDMNENSYVNKRTFAAETRLREETDGKLQVFLGTSPNISQQFCPIPDIKFKSSGNNSSQLTQSEIENSNSNQFIEAEKHNLISKPSISQVENLIEESTALALLKSKPTENIFSYNSSEDFPQLNYSAEDDLENLGNVYPKFKVGSPITDSRVLQMEASKICREIKKHQDFEMGCSLTSEKSLLSCSSFLDTGDFSLFESSTDLVDFDETESLALSRGSIKVKNISFRKPPPTSESISLPSLGSLRNDHLENLDLDNSVLSVASITSEIAETCSKEVENYKTYTKTCKANTPNDLMDDTAADITLVSNGDDTLNADSLQYNSELFDEDNSLHCQENLPLDKDSLQAAIPERTTKKLTPKEKRKTFHERYRTYTIRDVEGCKNFKMNSSNNSQVPTVDLTNVDVKTQPGNHGSDFNKYSLDKGDEYEKEKIKVDQRQNEHETFHFSKSLDKEHKFFPNCISDSKSLNNLLSIGPAERKELVDNAKLVAFSLKTAAREPEVSDSEADDQHKSLDIDTATYSKNCRHRFAEGFSSREVNNWEHCRENVAEEDLEKKGARILKPSDKLEEKLEEISKGVRGRRKPLYSSPQKSSQKTHELISNSPKTSQTVIESKSDKFPLLHREGTFTKEDGSDVKKFEAKNVTAIPVLNKNLEHKNASSSRPGAKNKYGLPAGSAKRVGENQGSRIGRPLSTYGSKNGEKRAESDSSHRRPYSAGAANRTGGDVTVTAKRPTSTGLTSPKIRNSSSNQNIKAGSSPGGTSVKSKNLSLQSSKSQSDANLNFVAKDKGSTSKQKTPKKEVTSKIASLWRKVEETKQKNKNVKDNRVWIGPEKSTRTSDEILVIEQEEIVDIPTRKIVHSYTCQALGDEISHANSEERDSRKFIGSVEDRRGKFEKRNIISAVVPPYNYNPPVSAQAAPSKVKQVDTFSKGSLKVTTV